MVGVGTFGGILLTEVNHSSYPLRLSFLSPLFAPPLFILALVLMSFPGDYQNQTKWSRLLLQLHQRIFPPLSPLDRTWPTLGALLLCFTVVMTPFLRRALSVKWLLWLGRISFPIYLLHGPLMRSILAWLLFANQTLVEMEDHIGSEAQPVMRYPIPNKATFIVVMPVFFAVLLTAANFWAQKVEPHFGTMTKRAEEIMFGKKDVAARPTVLPERQE